MEMIEKTLHNIANLPKTYRLTVVLTVAHQSDRDTPFAVRYARMLSDGEKQPYMRLGYQVGPDWTPVDTGWIKRPRFLVIENTTPVFQVNPTPEQLKAVSLKLLEIAHDSRPQRKNLTMHDDPLSPLKAQRYVPPGECDVTCPFGNVEQLRLRCPAGTTVNIFAVAE